MSEDAPSPSEAANEDRAPGAGPEAEGVRQEQSGKTTEGADQDKDKASGADRASSKQSDGQEQTASGAGQDGARTGDAGTGEQSSKTDSAGDNANKGPNDKPSKDQLETFKLYEMALSSADWAHKSKTGAERDLGHKSVGLAERAYVSAALYDKKAADEMWEKATHKPPKPELQARIDEARKVDPKQGIAELTAGLGTLREKQNLWNLTLNKEKLNQQMSNWESVIGDARERERDHQRKANEQLLSPERQGQHDDSGLEMFVRSLTNGWKAGNDLQAAKSNQKIGSEHQKLVKASRKAHGIVSKEIEEFEPGKGAEIKDTTGEVGRTSRRFGGVASMVRKVLDRKKGADDRTMEVPPKEPGQQKDDLAARMARQKQDAGIGR